MADLPALITPQFNQATNKLGFRAKPLPPVCPPEVPTRAQLFAARHRRREIWVGWPTVRGIWASRFAPAVACRYLAEYGCTSRITGHKLPENSERHS